MSISSHAKQQARGSPPRRAGPIRYATLGNGADDAEQRPAKAARSSCTMTAVPSCKENCYSWETRAFTEESKRQLDWPPRAYPCTFCEREFRSAQALGGHMNVHRRDRARLRHASPPLPPSPAFGSIAASPHSRSLLQAHDFSTVLSPAQCSSEWLESLHSPAIPLFNSNNISYTSLRSAHPSTEAASLPPRLQQLAFEAAASLSKYPHQSCKASDLFSRMSPLVANCGSFGCHSSKGGTVVNEKSPEIISTSSSFPSPPSSNASSSTPLPSIIDRAKRRWDNSMIEPDEERPWKANDRNQLLSHIITDSDALKEAHNSLDIRPFQMATANDMASMLRIKQAFESACGNRSGGDIDLELRLGRRPPSEEHPPSGKLA